MPKAYSAEQKAEIIRAVQSAPPGTTAGQVLKHLKVHPSRYYYWMKHGTGPNKPLGRPSKAKATSTKVVPAITPPMDQEVEALRALVRLAVSRGFLDELVGP